MKYNVYVISSGRHEKLPFNKEQKKEYIFCVGDGEKELYEKNGCKNVYESGKLMESRNYALHHAFKENKMCVQLSDDIKNVKLNENFAEKKEVELDFAIKEIVELFSKTKGVYLLGVPPTANHFFAKKMTVPNVFCIGDMLFVKPNDLRFDESLTLKEDYDYTLQHIAAYGIVIRYQKYIFNFAHYSNTGGAVAYRNDKEEKYNIRKLKTKWGDKIKMNPKRKNEILLNIKK